MSKGKEIQSALDALSGVDQLKAEAKKATLDNVKETISQIDKIIETAQAGNTAQKRVDRVVAKAAAETVSEARKKGKMTPAKNAEEFIIKYAQKRFSPSTAGKAYLLSFLLDAYNMTERGIKTTLWDMDLLKSKIHSEEDIQSFDAYYYLTEWLRILYEDSRTMRNALRSVISDFQHIATSVLAAENIRQRIIDTTNAKKLSTLSGAELREEIESPDTLLTLWLNTLTLEAYTPQSDGATLLQTLRDNIGEGLRYMRAYHTFLGVIAEYTGIPECGRLGISMLPIKDSLSTLNEALEALRDNVAAHREPEIMELIEKNPDRNTFHIKFILSEKDFLPASLTAWTPEYLKDTMEGFRPVEVPPPIPDERVDFLRDAIRRDFKKQYINWYVLYTRYSAKYRMPEAYTTPPTGRKGKKNSAKKQAEEAE